jgi:hypothetical protein
MPEDRLIAELIAQAVEKAIQPLQDRVSSLEGIIIHLQEENAALATTQAHLAENQEIQLRLICQLREVARKEPQPMQKDRADVLKALLAANGGKMLAKDVRQKMHLKKNHFAEVLRVCDFIDTKPYHLDRRQTVIILKSELVPRD